MRCTCICTLYILHDGTLIWSLIQEFLKKILRQNTWESVMAEEIAKALECHAQGWKNFVNRCFSNHSTWMTANVAILSEHVHCYMHLEDNCIVHVCIICVIGVCCRVLKILILSLFSGLLMNYRQNWPCSCSWIAMMFMQDFGVNMVKGTTKINAANI